MSPKPNVESENRALIEGAGFQLIDDRIAIRLTGDDRAEFLHGVASNDIKSAKPGSVVPAMFLTEHAHVIGEFFLWIEEDAFTLEADLGAWPTEREHLEKLLVADDVEMEELRPLAVLYVQGPRAAELLAKAGIAGGNALAPWTCSKSVNAILGRYPRFGADSFSLLGDRVVLSDIAYKLSDLGAVVVSEATLEVIRVERGIARVGFDTTAKTIALEARLTRAISMSKGCYLGQETIERATSRGGLKKKLYCMRFETPIEPGAVLELKGKEVGLVSSAVISPRLGPIGLAILHHSAWTPGVRLEVRGAGGSTAATVTDIPFISD